MRAKLIVIRNSRLHNHTPEYIFLENRRGREAVVKSETTDIKQG